MSMYSSRQLARYGHMGSAWGAFGGAALPVVGDLGFQSPLSLAEFLSRSGEGAWNVGLKIYGLSYNGPSSAMIAAANSGYQAFSALADTDADISVKFESLRKRTQTLIDNIDAMTAQKDYRGVIPQSVETQRVNYMKDLSRLLGDWQRGPALAKAAAAAAASAGTTSTTSTIAENQRLLDEALAKRPRQTEPSPYDEAPPTKEDKEEEGNTLLYVGLAAGAVLLLAGGILIAKRRRPSVSGYRRRRRRR
jgi:hypothetical protein